MQIGKGEDVNKVPRLGNIFMGTVGQARRRWRDESSHEPGVFLAQRSHKVTHTSSRRCGIVEGEGIVADGRRSR